MVAVDPSDVQGNILKGFDKPTARFIFFHFEDSNAARNWIRGLAKRRTLQNTNDLLDASKELKENRKRDPSYSPQQIWLHISLSITGIKKMSIMPPYSYGIYSRTGEKTKVIQEPDKEEGWDLSYDPFYAGMKDPDHAKVLGDTGENSSDSWVEPFRSGTYAKPDKSPVRQEFKPRQIDILLIVASDNQDDGDSYALQLIGEATMKGIICVGLQTGRALKNEQGKQVEHFGFRDGLSQPQIIGIDKEEIAKRTIYKDKFPPEEFVLYDLKGRLKWANNGSFLVFRRLRQDVPSFWRFMNAAGENLRLRPEELAAKLVGRWKSGAPLAKHTYEPTDPSVADDNDFVYVHNQEVSSGKMHPELDDQYGWRTPKFSHIRVSNPTDGETHSEWHRMLRRGIPYGNSWAEEENADRGLLFVSYQRDLWEQFVWIQNRLSSDTGHYSPPDPKNPQPNDEIKQLFLDLGQKIGLRNWVTTTGGEYFFSPSISALKTLGSRLLIVDGDAQMTTSLEEDLAKHGFTSNVFNDPTEVLGSFEVGRYDIAFIAMKFPAMDGSELYQQISLVDNEIAACFMIPPEEDVDLLKKRLKEKFPNSFSRMIFLKKPLSIDEKLVDVLIKTILESDIPGHPTNN